VVIAVDHGKVTLSGSVSSQAELDAVVGAARASSGVHDVDNRLYVDYRLSVSKSARSIVGPALAPSRCSS